MTQGYLDSQAASSSSHNLTTTLCRGITNFSAWNAIRYSFRIARREFEDDQWLFSPLKNPRGTGLDRPLDPSAIFYLVKRYAKLAGIQSRISPHSCRATAISNARDHHVPDRAIQEFAGWASPDMITRYDKRRTAVEKSAAHAIKYGAEERTPGSADLAVGEPGRPGSTGMSD